MDFGRAFGFVFNDPEWMKKILLGGLISLIPLIGGFVVYGYSLEVARRVYQAADEQLPQWDDFGGYLTRGFMLWVGLLVWFLPVGIIGACATGAVLAAGGSSGDDAASAASTIAAIGIFSVLFIVVMLWAITFVPIITGRYAVERNFGAMFQFSEIMAEIRQAGAGPLLMLLLIYIVAGFIGQLGFFACVIGVIFTSFYASVVLGHGAGQVYRRARGLPDVQASQQTTF